MAIKKVLPFLLIWMVTFIGCVAIMSFNSYMDTHLPEGEKDFDPAKYQLVKEKPYGTLTYKNAKYDIAIDYYLYVTDEDNREPQKNDVLLSWSGSKTAMALARFFYSDTEDDPFFIYEPDCAKIYFKEGYEKDKDIFVIKGTDLKITLPEFFPSSEPSFDEPKDFTLKAEFILVSQTHSRIHCRVKILEKNGNLYAYSSYILKHLSPLPAETEEILRQNNLLH